MATILLQNVGASTLTFTQKLQLAASGGTGSGPAGTVYDCTSYTNQSITSAIAFTVPNNTFLFGAGTFTFSPTSGSMFVISAPGITIQGTSRSSRDTPESGTTTFRMGNGVGQKYHIEYSVTSNVPTVRRGDSLTLKNLNFKGIQSVYTSNSGTVVYTTNGGGGILITENNPTSSGTNVNNVIIDNVLVDGAKQHGIMIYGAVASKIMNTRVRSAAGHGFYIDGESTSVSFDTCYASGNYLAGFCLKDAAYSSLNNCASDSNGLGYWLRNTTSTTLVSCGAEANLTRSNIPNNLGVILKQYPTGDYIVNDIGADNVNHIKGTSFFVSGGGNLTFTSPLSKDPGGNPGAGVFANKRTAHFGFYGAVDKVNITAPRISGTTTLKYKYRLEALDSSAPANIMIDDYVGGYDPTNPTESADPNPAVAVADVLDQGSGNVFGDMNDSVSFGGRRARIQDPTDNFRIDNLLAGTKFTLPTYTAHPANPEAGTIYFNTDLDKLFIFTGSTWVDTCCPTAPTPAPECVFPNGGLQTSATITGASPQGLGYALKVSNKIYMFTKQATFGNSTPLSENDVLLSMLDLGNGSQPVTISPIVTAGLANAVGIINTSASIGYSSLTNSLYFGVSLLDEASPNPVLGSTQMLYKYNISSGVIDATLSYDITSLNINDPEKVLGAYYTRYVVRDNKLYVISFANPYGSPNYLHITTRDLNSLALIDSYFGTINALNYTNGVFPQGGVNESSLLGNYFILNTNSVADGETYRFGLLDITDGSIINVEYDSSVHSGATKYKYQSITLSEDGNSILISNIVTGAIYEIPYSGIVLGDGTPTNIWSLGGSPAVAIDKTVNGNRFILYMRLTYNNTANNTVYSWVAHNLTDDITYVGSSGTENGNLLITRNNMLFDGGDKIYLTSVITQVKALCTPYSA
jgi:hypothetical protein